MAKLSFKFGIAAIVAIAIVAATRRVHPVRLEHEDMWVSPPGGGGGPDGPEVPGPIRD
jgi:hypothetical protein